MKESIDLKYSLKRYFNFTEFRPGQEVIIRDIMKGNDVLGVLPTGSGKSLCYQLPAKLLPGLTIVVSPLISLMIDQVKELKAMKFKEVVALNSFMEYTERNKIIGQLSAYKLLFISPELLQKPEIITRLQHINISLFVIDEAHCISQWGHEFRPDYLKLDHVIRQLNNPSILALSATATRHVQDDITNSLKKPEMIKHIFPMDRENIAFCIEEVESDYEKQTTLLQVLATHRTPTLIYFSSRRITEKVADMLMDKLPDRKIAYYHGGMDQMDRIAVQQQFMNNQLDIVCCTSAFGMGINKSDIYLIIHYHFPSQVESFIQEVGRAGRDGLSSVSILLYSNQDAYLPAKLIQTELPTESEMAYAFKQLQNLALDNKAIPTDEREIESLFQVNEIQWRYLYAQLEKNGIIKADYLNGNEEQFRTSFDVINRHRKKRLTWKQKKLSEMIHWINTTTCLRKALYKTFQNTLKKPTYHCCSNCGFSLRTWKPTKIALTEKKLNNWEEELKSIFLIEY